MLRKKKVLVLGDGAWGTALAILLDKNGHRVTLWSNFPDYARHLAKGQENTRFLPGVKIPQAIRISADTDAVLKDINLVVMAVPTQYARDVLSRIRHHLRTPNSKLRTIPVISVAKGIENETLKRPSEIIAGVLGARRIGVISGPSHAEEVARGLPATVVAASRSIALTKEIQVAFMNERFRIYTNSDIIGVEMGGALKNIIAIAAGVCDGLRLGDNAKSALLSRGLVEIARLGTALGARKSTFFGLSGLGDLITTCISPFGRNREVGIRLGRGETLKKILGSMQKVAEGIWTTKSALALAKKYEVEMPVTTEVYNVLFKDKKPLTAVKDLMTRQPKSEAPDLR